MPNRSKYDIMYLVTYFAQTGAKKGDLKDATSLQSTHLREILGEMEQNKMLSYDRQTMLYWTTEKGRRFMKRYVDMMREFPSGDDKVLMMQDSTPGSR